jgi:hypothetical protein
MSTTILYPDNSLSIGGRKIGSVKQEGTTTVFYRKTSDGGSERIDLGRRYTLTAPSQRAAFDERIAEIIATQH